jgi:hypothetical protein
MMERENTTNHDIKGANLDEDDGGFITADSPAKPRIHIHHLDVVRLGKAALMAAIETGAVLHEERTRRGDDFEEWVDKQLAVSREEAAGYIRYYESGVRPEQLSPAVEVKLDRVLELLGQLHTAYSRGPAQTHPAETADKANHGQSKLTVGTDIDNTPNQQASKDKQAASGLVKALDRAKKRPTKAATNAKPVRQDRDDRQSALTPEQQHYLVRRSPRLFAQVRKGELLAEEALRLARDLPDRCSPHTSQKRLPAGQGQVPTNLFETQSRGNNRQ